MKNLSAWLILWAIPTLLFAQSPSVDRFFDAYGQEEAYSVVNVQGNLVNFFMNRDGESSEIMIEDLKFLNAPVGAGKMDDIDILDLKRKLERESFSELSRVSDGHNEILFLMDEHNGNIHELVMLLMDGDQYIVLSLRGNIPLSNGPFHQYQC